VLPRSLVRGFAQLCSCLHGVGAVATFRACGADGGIRAEKYPGASPTLLSTTARSRAARALRLNHGPRTWIGGSMEKNSRALKEFAAVLSARGALGGEQAKRLQTLLRRLDHALRAKNSRTAHRIAGDIARLFLRDAGE
jgi:hypothetical protein